MAGSDSNTALSNLHSKSIHHACELVRRSSVTPLDGECLSYCQSILEPLGFVCHRLDVVEGQHPAVNLFAERPADPCAEKTSGHSNASYSNDSDNGIGSGGGLGFCGHVDVVPPGDTESWTSHPFIPTQRDGWLYGRGTEDMKGAIASYFAAIEQVIEQAVPLPRLVVMLTSDEEGPATNGTRKIVEWAVSHNKMPKHCIVGEPASSESLADQVKIGRRGSLSCELIAHGTQGHAAYPHLACNPVSALAELLTTMIRETFFGSESESGEHAHNFGSSTMCVTSIDTNNPASNVIPATCTACFNIRFTPQQTPAQLMTWAEQLSRPVTERSGVRFDFKWRLSAEPFINIDQTLLNVIEQALLHTGHPTPSHSTSGGTSDGRFIAPHCPTVELGHVSGSMHQVDERVSLDHLGNLAEIYSAVILGYNAIWQH